MEMRSPYTEMYRKVFRWILRCGKKFVSSIDKPSLNAADGNEDHIELAIELIFDGLSILIGMRKHIIKFFLLFTIYIKKEFLLHFKNAF